jgi:Protein of unknown function (DUF3489)
MSIKTSKKARAPQQKRKPAEAPTAPADQVAAPARLTKPEQLRQLLERQEGASLAEICAAFGWLPHSARAALSRLRKEGATIERAKLAADGPSERPAEIRYRIAAPGDGNAEAAQ